LILSDRLDDNRGLSLTLHHNLNFPFFVCETYLCTSYPKRDTHPYHMYRHVHTWIRAIRPHCRDPSDHTTTSFSFAQPAMYPQRPHHAQLVSIATLTTSTLLQKSYCAQATSIPVFRPGHRGRLPAVSVSGHLGSRTCSLCLALGSQQFHAPETRRGSASSQMPPAPS